MESVSSTNAIDRQMFEHLSHSAVQEAKSHWPTWAVILVVACVILSVLAFLLGNLITRKSTSLRVKGTAHSDIKDRERKWGAGFSGGLWAAA